jgi:hypothetical protein
MSRTVKSKDFKKLQSEWYDKLKASGFKDIEFNENSPYVRDNHLRIRRRVKRGWRTGQQALFEAATDYLRGATASRRSERIHIALFVAGMPAAKIAARYGATLRAVQKQVYGFLALVRKDAKEAKEPSEQAEDSSPEAGGYSQSD